MTTRESIDALIDSATIDFPNASTRFDVLDQVMAHTMIGLRILADGIDDLNSRFEVFIEGQSVRELVDYEAQLAELSVRIDGLTKRVKKKDKKAAKDKKAVKDKKPVKVR
jgi:hypothetical protein